MTMKWFENLFKDLRPDPTLDLKTVQSKFENFVFILDTNNFVLKIISDLEEKSQGDYLFDLNYVRDSLGQLRGGVGDLVQAMLSLGGGKYGALQERFTVIANEIDRVLPGNRPVVKGPYVLTIETIDNGFVSSVGGKNAQLGDLRTRLGLPVPSGFAISTWACNHFFQSNNLETRIGDCLHSLSIKCTSDLLRASREIWDIVMSSPVPEDLARDILDHYDDLVNRHPCPGVALRSSAVGEDTSFSFAGQYATFLNVPRSDIVPRYREILASKFTPQAIYYALSHALSSSDLAMGVGCLCMIDARASGVVYTRDPVRPDENNLLIHSIFGLGKYLVDGHLTPDVFRVSRHSSTIIEANLSRKPVRLVARGRDGIVEEAVPEADQTSASVSAEELKHLTEFAMKIEDHYGGPQDIEWAIDQSGRIFILQARPLRVLQTKSAAPVIDTSHLTSILTGGVTICPGAGTGPVHKAFSISDLSEVPEGAVLVTLNPFPGIVTVMERVAAIVTCVGNVASHMATLAREYRVPALGGVQRALEMASGQVVTVDATGSAIYAGANQDLISARRLESDLFADAAIFELLKNILSLVAPLNLVHPADPTFLAENCKTFHDITRFIHQKALEEMFYGATHIGQDEQICLRLKSDCPLRVDIIYIDQDVEEFRDNPSVAEDEIQSEPMQHFWRGVRSEGWPAPVGAASARGFVGVLATSMIKGGEAGFSENSFAVLGREYMMLSLRLGYHYSTIEAYCSAQPSKNYIRIQYKNGGASLDRRIRRINLIVDLLSLLGFEHSCRGDYLDASLTYQDRDETARKLYLLGRISIKTKQLDLALSNDAVASWYTEEFINALQLRKEKTSGDEE